MIRLHLLTAAFLVLAGLLWLVKLTREEPAAFHWSPWILMILLGLEIMLGIESGMNWMARNFAAVERGNPIGLLMMRHRVTILSARSSSRPPPSSPSRPIAVWAFRLLSP